MRDTHPALVVITNEYKAVGEVKTASPATFVVFRITGHDWLDQSSYAGGMARAEEYLPTWRGIGADAYSLFNEIDPNDELIPLQLRSDTYRGAMMVATGLGMTITVGDFSTGRPMIEKPAVLDAIRPMLAQAEGRHILNLHSYPVGGNPYYEPENYLLRFKPVFEQYPRLKVLYGEYAPDNGGEGLANLMSGADDLLRPYPQVIGLARFTLGVGWADFGINLETYRQYMR